MRKGIIIGALVWLTVAKLQAQSTASGSSNTGNPTTASTPAQNGSTGSTVAPKTSSMNQGQSKSSGRKVKSNSKVTKTHSATSSGR